MADKSEFEKARDEAWEEHEKKYPKMCEKAGCHRGNIYSWGADWAYEWCKKHDEQYYAVLELEIKQLRAKLEIAREALKKVKHNGCCLVCSEHCPSCNAHKALAQIDKED